MTSYPTNELETLSLCQQMIAGYIAHPEDFPSVTAEMLAELQGAMASYNGCRDNQDSARAQAKLATANKSDCFAQLSAMMKDDLKLSEVDCAANPEKLAEIGWGTRQHPQPVPAPGQPLDAASEAQGPGDLWLVWKRPVAAESGPVRSYIIERREQLTPGGDYTAWKLAGTCLEPRIHLTEQPRGIQMEYRIKATNLGGQSLPSNTVAVVL